MSKCIFPNSVIQGKKIKKTLQGQTIFFFEYKSGFVMVVPQNLRFPFCWKYFFLKSQLFQTRSLDLQRIEYDATTNSQRFLLFYVNRIDDKDTLKLCFKGFYLATSTARYLCSLKCFSDLRRDVRAMLFWFE